MLTRRIIFVGIAIAMICVVGYASTAMSRFACLQSVAQWIVNDLLSAQAFNVHILNEESTSRAAFDSTGAKYALISSNPYDVDAYPCVTIKTNTYPFLLSVDYLWEREPEIGSGATRWFLCIFGRIVEIGTSNQHET